AAPFNSGVSILASGGSEMTRLTKPVGSPIFPYDSPANIAFDKDGTLVLTNHAFVTGGTMPSQFTILKVFLTIRSRRLRNRLFRNPRTKRLVDRRRLVERQFRASLIISEGGSFPAIEQSWYTAR